MSADTTEYLVKTDSKASIGIDYYLNDINIINDKFKIGTRLSLTIINTSHIVVKTAAKLHDVKADVKISLIPIMVGGSYNKNISEKFSLNGKLFCGVGLINFKSNCSFVLHETQEKWHNKIDENSCCFIADFSV